MVDYNGTGNKQNIISCANMVISTVQGTMPYMRDMGISNEIISRSTRYAEDAFISDVIGQIETWDSRVLVREIQMDSNKEGILEAKVVLEDGE